MTTKVRNLSLASRDRKTVKALREDVSPTGWSALADWYADHEQPDLAIVWRWYAAILAPVVSVLRSPVATMDEWNRRKMRRELRTFRALPGGRWRDGRGHAPAVVPRWLYGVWCPRQHEERREASARSARKRTAKRQAGQLSRQSPRALTRQEERQRARRMLGLTD